MQLIEIHDRVLPCFAPSQHAFDTIFAKFHEHLSFMLDSIGAVAASLPNNDILQVLPGLSGLLARSLARTSYARSHIQAGPISPA